MRRSGRVVAVVVAAVALVAGPSLFVAEADTCVPETTNPNEGQVCIVRFDTGLSLRQSVGVTAGTDSSGVTATVGCDYSTRPPFDPRYVYVQAGLIGSPGYVSTAPLGPDVSPAIHDAACPVIDAVGDAVAG